MKFIIDFKNSATQEQIDSYLLNNGCSVIKNWSWFDKIYLVEVANTPASDAIVDHIINDHETHITPLDVITVDQYAYSHSNPADEKIVANNNSQTDWWKVYSYIKPNFDGTTTTYSRLGRNVNVYVLDSGVDSSHPEFVDANIVQLYSINGDFTDNKGHGTAIASVISGKNTGITNATIKSVKIFEPNHNTLQSELLSALDAVANDHVPNTFSIINASWAINKNQWVEFKLRELISSGIFVVTSAGNNGVAIEDVTPASMADVLTVGAYNKDLVPCDFSNFTGNSMTSLTQGSVNHGALDGWAPGQDIYCAGYNGSYGYVSGTSIAAGITSAVLAVNASLHLQASGIREPGYEEDRISPTTIFNGSLQTFSRYGLLEYNDPKYANSKNLIATIIDISIIDQNQVPDELSGYVTVDDPIRTIVKLYTPSKTVSIEFTEQLPLGFVISKDGLLHGSVNNTSPLAPGVDEPTVVRTLNFIRNNIDGSVENCVVNLYVLSSTFDKNSVASDDPLNLVLNAVCDNAVAEACGGGGIIGSCTNVCAGALVCCSSAPKPIDQSCVCTFGGGLTCFAGETLITMADHTTKAIESIREGDKVLAFNFDSGSVEENIVTNIHVRINRDVYQFTLSNGHKLIVTDDHPLYVLGKGWCSNNPRQTMRAYKSLRNDLVARIKVGDKLFHKDLESVEILDIKRTEYPGKVYTFNNKYKSSPTFFADGILAY